MGGMTSLLLLLWAGVTLSTVVDLQKRIIGGQQCKPDERRYHVKISDANGRLICGSSLISDQWILTAAHCWDWTMNAVVGVHPGPGETMRITAPPVMFSDNNNRLHDIMLLKLPKATKIPPVELPDCQKRPTIGTNVQIAGYAATVADPQNQKLHGESKTVHCADIKLVNCQGLRNTIKNINPEEYRIRSYHHMLCGQTPKVDTCPGDSGGGVVYDNMIYGVHSVTGGPRFACTEPAGFMEVCEYKEWIEKTTTKQNT